MDRAESSLAEGDYPQAGSIVRDLLAEGLNEPDLRARTLAVLGTVLFYNSRVLFHFDPENPEGPQEQAAREEAIALAERAFRDAIALGGEGAQRARVVLSELLLHQDRRGELEELSGEYDTLRADGPTDPRLVRVRRCLDFRNGLDAATSAGEEAPVKLSVRSDIGQIRPERIAFDMPQYTHAASRSRISGSVIVQVIIDREGRVACARPLRGLPLGLTEATLAAAYDWRFEPIRIDGGEPHPISYNLSITYSQEPGTGSRASGTGTLFAPPTDRSFRPDDTDPEAPLVPVPPPRP